MNSHHIYVEHATRGRDVRSAEQDCRAENQAKDAAHVAQKQKTELMKIHTLLENEKKDREVERKLLESALALENEKRDRQIENEKPDLQIENERRQNQEKLQYDRTKHKIVVFREKMFENLHASHQSWKKQMFQYNPLKFD